jgi:hypothetical protein
MIGLACLALVGGAFYWGSRHASAPPPSLPPAPVIAPVAPPPPPPAPEPVIRHPIETPPAPRAALPALDDSDDYLKKALDELLGRKSVLSFVLVDGLARRFVATVNNLATDSATAQMWPVRRTDGHFETEAQAGSSAISARNADRYAAFVAFVTSVDTQRAVSLYVRLYPLFQRAYTDLGFPDKYFNDRLVEVIDNLLATPDLAEPIKVKLVTVEGAARPPGAGGLYVFDDPALEARSSGQKILLRMGRANAAKLKAKLTDLRRRIAQGPVARAAHNQ